MRRLFGHGKERRLAEALAASLDALRDGSATVADCLRRYPDLADELAPLLQTSERLAVLAGIEPPEQARLAARRAFLDAAAARRRPVPVAPRPVVHRRGWLVFAPVGVAAMLFLAIAVPVLGSMDSGAVPGDWNYAFKRSTERVRLALTVDSSDRRLLRLEFAQRRLNEIERLSNNGHVDGHSRQVAALLKDYTADVNQATGGLPATAVQQSTSLVDQATPVLDKLQSVPADDSVKSAATDAASATSDLATVAKNTPASGTKPPKSANAPGPSPTPARPASTQTSEAVATATEAPPTATPVPETPTPVLPSSTPPVLVNNQTPTPPTQAPSTPQPVPTRSGVDVITPVVPTLTPAPVRTPVPADTPASTPSNTNGLIASSTPGPAPATQPSEAGTATQPSATAVAPTRTPTVAPPTPIATRGSTVVPATLDQVTSAPGQTVYRWNGAPAPLDAVLASLAGTYSVVYYADASGQVKAWYPGTPAPAVGTGTLITVVLKPASGR